VDTVQSKEVMVRDEMEVMLPSSVVSTATYSCGTTASNSSTKGVEILFYDRCEDK
jgi:hypothetical protein